MGQSPDEMRALLVEAEKQLSQAHMTNEQLARDYEKQNQAILSEAEQKLAAAFSTNQQLSDDNSQLNTALDHMMEAQVEEAEDMDDLTEKCLMLEKALEEALSENAEIMNMVKGLTSGLKSLKSKADKAIERAKTETSSVALAEELQELASEAQETDLDQFFNKMTKPLDVKPSKK